MESNLVEGHFSPNVKLIVVLRKSIFVILRTLFYAVTTPGFGSGGDGTTRAPGELPLLPFSYKKIPPRFSHLSLSLCNLRSTKGKPRARSAPRLGSWDHSISSRQVSGAISFLIQRRVHLLLFGLRSSWCLVSSSAMIFDNARSKFLGDAGSQPDRSFSVESSGFVL